MTTIRLRCSSLSLIEACPAAALPADPRIESASEAADLGSANHFWLARAVAGNKTPEFDALAKRFGIEDVAELERLCWWSWRAWEQVREHFPDPMTEVALEHGDITGHVDVLSIQEDLVSVLDFKTGRQDLDHSAQLKGYAYLALCHYPRPTRAYVCTLRIREQTVDGAYYSWDELREWADGLRASVTGPPVYRPGPHCTYCPRGATCPAKTELLRQAAESLGSIDRGSAYAMHDHMTANHGAALANLLGHVKLLEAACETARDLIRADVAALGGVVPTGDGRELVLREVATRKVSALEAWDLLAEELTEQTLLESVVQLPKTKIEDAVRSWCEREGAKTGLAIKKLMARLEAAGAMRTTYQTRLEVRRASNPEPTAALAGDAAEQLGREPRRSGPAAESDTRHAQPAIRDDSPGDSEPDSAD